MDNPHAIISYGSGSGGAGVFGAWIALPLSRGGNNVTLIDRFGPANEQSSSAGESRIIRSAYGPEEIYTSMARRSLELWKSFLRARIALNAPAMRV